MAGLLVSIQFDAVILTFEAMLEDHDNLLYTKARKAQSGLRIAHSKKRKA